MDIKQNWEMPGRTNNTFVQAFLILLDSPLIHAPWLLSPGVSRDGKNYRWAIDRIFSSEEPRGADGNKLKPLPSPIFLFKIQVHT